MDKKEFCFNCGEETRYIVRSETVDTEMGDIKFSYEALAAYCTKCGQEISVPEINDLNVIRAYQKHKEILEKS